MKVTLINPNYLKNVYGGETGGVSPPMGLAYIAAVLKSHGIDVNVIEANALSLEMEDINKEIIKSKPDIIGITATTPMIEDVGIISHLAKEYKKDVVVVVGGAHTSALPDDLLLRYKTVDICVVGEGEQTIIDLVQTLNKGNSISWVKGIAYKKNGDIKINEKRTFINELDTLPFPAWDLLPMERYRYTLPLGKKRGYFAIVCNRGCPFNCTFCSQCSVFGKKVRFRSEISIADEIEHLIRSYNIDSFGLSCSTFSVNRERVMNICNEFIKRKLKIKWQCTTRVNLVDFEMLTKMKQAGCEIVSYGIESASQKVLDILKKDITLEDTIKAVQATKKAGIKVYMDFMLGTPGETKEMIDTTIDFAKRLDGDYAQFSLTTPFPGSELYDTAQKMGLIKPEDLSKFRYYIPSFPIEGLSTADLKDLRAKAFRNFYVRPDYILKQALKVRSINDLIKLAKQALSLKTFTRRSKTE